MSSIYINTIETEWGHRSRYKCGKCYEGFPNTGKHMLFQILPFSDVPVMKKIIEELFNKDERYCLLGVSFFSKTVWCFLWVHDHDSDDIILDKISKLEWGIAEISHPKERVTNFSP